jgi:hypothetical protein
LLIQEEQDEVFSFIRDLHKVAFGKSAILLFPSPRRKVMTETFKLTGPPTAETKPVFNERKYLY